MIDEEVVVAVTKLSAKRGDTVVVTFKAGTSSVRIEAVRNVLAKSIGGVGATLILIPDDFSSPRSFEKPPKDIQ